MGPKTTIPDILTAVRPENALPLVFDSPHSGDTYPADFDYSCDFATLELTEDKYVDDLFADAPEYGAAFLCAHFPRSYIDVNRCEKDIDPDLLEELLPEEANPSARSDAGIGLIRRLIRPGLQVYDRHLSLEEVQKRIEGYYRPYHAALSDLIETAYSTHGQIWHINCHSMPPQKTHFPGNAFKPAEIVLGDRDGTSCSIDLRETAAAFFKSKGYKVAVNDPYKGVELVDRYSDPARSRHSLQIEICKSLYLEEDLKTKSRNYKTLKADLTAFTAHMADFTRSNLMPLAAD